MLLRRIFLLTLVAFAVAGYGTVWLYAKFILVTNTDVHSYAYVQANIFVTVLLVVIAGLFFMVIRSIGTPVRNLTKAIQTFAERNERIPVPISRTTPYEIRMLIIAFGNLIEHVEMAHRREAEVSHVKSDFITTAAHQLRTPLTGIRWALEALEKENTVSDEQRALIESAVEKSHQLVNVVSTLLNISAIESGKHKYTFVAVDINEFLPMVVNDFQHMAQERSVTLAYQPADYPLVPVRADREQIRWILNNLIENALRYTPAGGRVDVWAEPLGTGNILVHVRDTGIGIPKTERGNIFERFYRADNAIAKENEGNGLGLHIARAIAKDHGGDLNFAANAESIGTTFTLSLLVAG